MAISMPKPLKLARKSPMLHEEGAGLAGNKDRADGPTASRRKKLLFITNTRLGDAVLTTGLLAEAVERFWPCDVTIACGPVPAPLFAAVPGLQRIILLDKKEKGVEWLRLWKYAAQFYWDAIIDLRNSFVSYLILRKKVFRYTRMNTAEHKCAQLAKVMKLAGVPYNRIWLSDAAQKRARELLPAGAPILALCPTSGWGHKNWPAERVIELARRLPFQRAAILSAPRERERITPIIDALRDKLEVIGLSDTDPLEAVPFPVRYLCGARFRPDACQRGGGHSDAWHIRANERCRICAAWPQHRYRPGRALPEGSVRSRRPHACGKCGKRGGGGE